MVLLFYQGSSCRFNKEALYFTCENNQKETTFRKLFQLEVKSKLFINTPTARVREERETKPKGCPPTYNLMQNKNPKQKVNQGVTPKHKLQIKISQKYKPKLPFSSHKDLPEKHQWEYCHGLLLNTAVF